MKSPGPERATVANGTAELFLVLENTMEGGGAEEGSKVEEKLRLLIFNGAPSAELFSTQIEPSNVPAVFRGAVKDWKAVSAWDPRNGGLDYLQEREGSTIVEAMLSGCAPVFYGDLRSHERVPIPFSTFISSCKSCQTTGQESEIATIEQPSYMSLEMSRDDYSVNQMYIAQVPIFNAENKERSVLEILKEDIDLPGFLESKPIASINFWMNCAKSRSSTHYDPQHNLLCIVTGCKQVLLWPPSATPLLYPMPVHGEASNHSAADIVSPDLALHSRAKYLIEYSQKAILKAGDTVFIPEGWYHQVDSDDMTIAVNIWWKSNIMSNMLEHMDAYYLRRILSRLVGKEMDQQLYEIASAISVAEPTNLRPVIHPGGTVKGCRASSFNDESESKNDFNEHGETWEYLEAGTRHALHELISLVHDNVDALQDETVKKTSLEDTESFQKSEQENISTCTPSLLEHDQLASFLWALEPLILRKIFLVMVDKFPRTLEFLILHMLSPTAAEILTRKFDDIDKQTTNDEQKEFYTKLYSSFDDQFAAMDKLLSGKETFSFQAFKNVLDQYLGVNVVQPQQLCGRRL